MKDKHLVGEKRPDMGVTWPFIRCYFLGPRRTLMRPQATSEAITFEQNDLPNLNFVKDEHTYIQYTWQKSG